MNTRKLILATVAVAGLVATSFSADALPYRHRYHRHTFNRFTGATPNYARGLNLRKQTRTGGPVGGQGQGNG